MLNLKMKLNDEDIGYTSSIIASNEKYSMKKPRIQYKAETKNVNSWKVENHKKITSCTMAKKKSPATNCCFSMVRRRCRSVSPSSLPPTTTIDVSAKIPPTMKMQTLRTESLSRCKKLLRCNGYPNKVLLYAEESWARTAASSYWTLSPIWWNCNRCKVVEVTGTKRYTAQAKMIETDSGNLYIVGSFKKCADPDFKFELARGLENYITGAFYSRLGGFIYKASSLTLTANITIADFNMGYCMTGSLERGSRKHNSYQTTHFAVVRRAEFNV